MARNQSELCKLVLKTFDDVGILNKIVVVGSWCIPFYDSYFKQKSFFPRIRTRDMDFLIPISANFPQKVDIKQIMKSNGFLVDYKGRQGFTVLVHPELMLEFLVPSCGRTIDTAYKIESLGINAQRLRFMDILLQSPIKVKYEKLQVNVPHPANYALHKLLVAGRRKDLNKGEKDRAQALSILKALNNKNDFQKVKSVYDGFPGSWQKTINRELRSLDQSILKLF